MKSLINRLRKKQQHPDIASSKLLKDAFKFVVNECVMGDYYEFGVFQGSMFINATRTFDSVVQRRQDVADTLGDGVAALSMRAEMAENMRFHAFDSFQGLPKLKDCDLGSADFVVNQFRCTRDDFQKNIAKAGVSERRVSIHEGWFDQLALRNYTEGLPKAAVVWIDCDLYSSAAAVYQLITPLIQDGTVIIIDDWFSYKGSQFRGQQLAFYEWTKSGDISDKYAFNQFNKEGWKRNSFIINAIR